MNESYKCGNHSLISRHKVVKELPALLALTFHIIRDRRREVIVLILLSLPIRYIGLDRKELTFALPYRLIHRNGVCVDRQHKATVNIGQLCNKAILDEVGIILEIQNSCISTIHLEKVAFELKGLRGKCDLEVVTSLGIEESVISEIILISLVEEIVKNTNLIFLAYLLKLGAKLCKESCKLCTYAIEISLCFFKGFLFHRNRHKLVLHNACREVGVSLQDRVIFSAIAVKAISNKGEHIALLKLAFLNTAVIDGDLGRGSAVKGVQNLGITEEHSLFIFS